MSDQVNHPSHYGGDRIYEVIKVCEAWGIDDAYLFNVIKYIARAGKKENEKYIEALEKASFYLERKIENMLNPPDWENYFAGEIVVEIEE